MTVRELIALLKDWDGSLPVCVDGVPLAGLDHFDEDDAVVVRIHGISTPCVNLAVEEKP